MIGRIKSVIYSRKYGFIKGKDKQEYYFKFEDVEGLMGHMHIGNSVSFEAVKTDEKNPRAVSIYPDEYEDRFSYVAHYNEKPGGKGWYWVILGSDQSKAVPGFWNGEYWSDIDVKNGWKYIDPVGWMRMDFPKKGDWHDAD